MKLTPSKLAPLKLAPVKSTLVKLLSEVTLDGYVFRVDLRLRPDPSSNPICIGLASAERYYESYGRNWERAAFIKARPAAGAPDPARGARSRRRLSRL